MQQGSEARSFHVDFEAIKAAGPPEPDELEVALIGPGFGESVVAHVGGNRWLVVDSCIENKDETRECLPLKYLRAIGVDTSTCVDLIVATHWHDDHVRGLAELVRNSPSAKFACPDCLTGPEFAVFVEQMSEGATATDGAKLREFRQILSILHERGQSIRWATAGKTLIAWSELEHGSQCRAISLSPSDKEKTLFLQEVADASPKALQPQRAATARRPNLVSTVVVLEIGNRAVLLGADLENHRDTDRGWTAAIREAQVLRTRRGGLVKIPHHGSTTAHHDGMWSELLEEQAFSALTPFTRIADALQLPTDEDVGRICTRSTNSYSAALRRSSKSAKHSSTVDRSLAESGIVVRPLMLSAGMARFRARLSEQWRVQLFSPATELSKLTRAAR